MNASIVPGSESKKRVCEEFEKLPEIEPKTAEIRDHDLMLCSEGKVKANTTSALDLNANNDSPSCIEDTSHLESRSNCVKSNTFCIDLNSEDVFHPYKDYEHVKPRDALSQCGSTCNLEGEQNSMRAWKEMKQNGFLSSSHGGLVVPPVPKSRGRKKANENMIKKKIEIAKKEQVDRFAKIAAPCGLLKGLNPGIITHVRNQKQVRSIIENIVRSAKNENNNGGIRKDIGKKRCEQKDLEILTFNTSHACQSDELHPSKANKSSLSNEESGNISTVNSISFRAASVASQWLELLHQDIKGRLAALRRSKKRVRAVIQTELPFLALRELGSYQENDRCAVRNAENGDFDKGTADLHRARWGALFDQMDSALAEEQKHLESLLNQVNEMLMHCEHGLEQFHLKSGLLKGETSAYQDLAVQAAAAAIYATFNFLQSTKK